MKLIIFQENVVATIHPGNEIIIYMLMYTKASEKPVIELSPKKTLDKLSFIKL